MSTHERVLTPTQMREATRDQPSQLRGAGDADDFSFGAQPQQVSGEFGDAILRVSDLVDKYWNGSKSLLKNIRFKSLTHSLPCYCSDWRAFTWLCMFASRSVGFAPGRRATQ